MFWYVCVLTELGWEERERRRFKVEHDGTHPAAGLAAPVVVSSLPRTMDPPSLRELELETLLRERDSQVAELTVRYAFVPVSRVAPTHSAAYLLG